MKVEDKTLFLKPILGKSASKASQKPAFSSNTLRITNNTVQEGFKRNITLAAKKYTFSFFMDKGLEDLNDKEYFSVDILNSTNAIVYTFTTKVNATGYYNFDYSATTAGTYTWRFRRVSLNGRSSSGTAYFDDFKVSYNTQQSQQVCSSPKNYRFGFNTQEKDDEVYGAGNLNTAEFWEYDTRIGRRWNIDPVVKEWESPYATFANNPIWYSDVNGDDPIIEGSGKTVEASPGITTSEDKCTLFNNPNREGKGESGDWDYGTWNDNKNGGQGGYDLHSNSTNTEEAPFKSEITNKDVYDFVSSTVTGLELKLNSMKTSEMSKMAYDGIKKFEKYTGIKPSLIPQDIYKSAPQWVKNVGLGLTFGAGAYTVGDMLYQGRVKGSHLYDLSMVYFGYKYPYFGLGVFSIEAGFKLTNSKSIGQRIDQAIDDKPELENDGVLFEPSKDK